MISKMFKVFLTITFVLIMVIDALCVKPFDEQKGDKPIIVPTAPSQRLNIEPPPPIIDSPETENAEATSRTQEKTITSSEAIKSTKERKEESEVSEEAVKKSSGSDSMKKNKKRKYIVKPGDYLIKIAREKLGDPERYWDIVELNKHRYPSLVKNPSLIYPGWELELPEGFDDEEFTTPDATAEEINNAEDGVVETSSSLNVRTKPWGPVIGSLQNGEKIRIIKREGAWYKIVYNGKIGYVHANYVTTKHQKAGLTPVDRPVPTGDRYSDPIENDDSITPGSGRFGGQPCSPLPSYASSEYGYRTLFGQREFHSGIDLPVPNGTRINAVGDGVVVKTGVEAAGGVYVKIRYDNGYEMVYCHLRNYSVREGQRVAQGQEIGRSDNTGRSTGPHLHLGVKKNGVSVNPRSVPGLILP